MSREHVDAGSRTALEGTRAAIIACRRCPRLVARREEAARHPPAAHQGERYWARPVPGFGDPGARIFILGLATAAHGGNRTGRAFTGNPSADWLLPAMYRAGFADRPTSVAADDGLTLRGAWMASVVRCAPPANRPTPRERDACLPHLGAEIAALPRLRVVLALGGFAWAAVQRQLDEPPRTPFGHGVERLLPGGLTLVGSYHPSRRNTATGLLTAAMLDGVLRRCRDLGSP